jgi:tetratricopeptide (TPR) repeat protein
MIRFGNATSLLWFFLFLLFQQQSVAQKINFSRYFNQDVIPVMNPEEYPALEFEWNIPGNVQTYMNSGLTELEEKNYTAAIENFSEVIKLLPSFVPGYYYRGVSHKAQGQLDEAEQDLKKTISFKPSPWQGHLQLGEIFQMRGDLDKATEQFEESISINSKMVHPYFNLGQIELRKGNPRKASKFFEQCIGIQNDFAKAFVMQGLMKLPELSKRNKEALNYFDKALTADSTSKEALFWRGLAYISLDQPEKTLTDWDKLVLYNPTVSNFIILRGFLNIELERYDYAFADLRKAVLNQQLDEESFKGGQTLLDKQIDVQYATQYVMRNSYGLKSEAFEIFKKGYCLFLAGHHANAIKEFKKADSLETAAVIYYSLAISHEHSRDHIAALDYYNKALALDNDIFDAHKKRAIYRTELKDWKGANEDFNHMQRIQPGSKITYKLRGFTRISFKDYYGAIIDFTRYIKNDSTDSEVFVNRGYCHDQVKNYSGAVDDYLQALRFDSLNLGLYQAIASELQKNNDSLRSWTILREGTQKLAKSPEPWVILAELELKMKKFDEASQSIDTAFSKTPQGFFYTKIISRAFFVKGMVLYHQKNYKGSSKEFTKAIEITPNHFESLYFRAKSYLYSGQVSAAIKEFKSLGAKGYLDSQEIYFSLLKQK